MSEEQTAGIILPTDPEAVQKIKLVIKEICNAKTRIKSEQSYIKEAVKALSKEHQLPETTINTNVKWYFDQNMGNALGKLEDAQCLYETIFAATEES